MSEFTEFSDDELGDHEFPEPDEDDHGRFIKCPECHKHFYEDAEMCPSCGHFLEPDTSVWSGKPWWWTLLAILGIAGLVGILLLGV